jgi:Zn-dependent M28 family amino/carboxypeptidase
VRRKQVSEYLLSVPERILRSATALAGGLLREAGDVALPAFVRKTRLYNSLVESTLRFLIEQVGQVEGAYPSGTKLAEDFLLRRTAGNGLELIGVLTFRASPVWVMAALADVSGAGRQLISEIAAEMKKEGLLPLDTEISSVEQMLDGLERTAGRMAETVNTPPLDVEALRQEWADIRREVSSIPAPNLPSANDLWKSWRELTNEASRQNRSVWELSSLIAFGAVTRLPENLRWLGKSAALAARRTGEIFAGALLGHYRDALTEIHHTGYLKYLMREYRPYLRAAALQFSPKRVSLTERILGRNPLIAVCCLAVAAANGQQHAKPAAPAKTVTGRVSPDALRAHVSFLASDAMQGRDTPSHELDIAAEYIAAQFRGSGLDARFQVSEQSMYLRTPSGKITISADEATVPPGTIFAGVRLTKVGTLEGLSADKTRGRLLITTPDIAVKINSERDTLRPGQIIAVADVGDSVPEGARIILIRSERVREVYNSLPEGITEATVTIIPAGQKNVIGVLPGTDPALRDQVVIISAHYDHVGVRSGGDGDRVYNGANDNASGTAGVIEAAAAITRGTVKPRRTIAFITWFGEEKGLVGAYYYAAHPVFPTENTVAALNLEQLGRTDDSEGPRISSAILTGFGFSEAGQIITRAAVTAGVKIENIPAADDFFGRSDNQALADAGVPAHTLAVAFMFPDYHQPGDEWQKIDYTNMAKITQAVAASALALANRPEAVHWLKGNPKAERYWRHATPLSKPREGSAPVSGNSPASPKPRRSKP